ncbi:hypothetical protein FGO68_gene5428 [Halteria grandinella]|uniref:Uncharacterized protein n=1 Tax=Halteria grandinella TaxID=5974 RepID=A0A8J8P1H3_HALGN|nr:hypothetical protein FGO68_gene5428 [Halteria grandinella]
MSSDCAQYLIKNMQVFQSQKGGATSFLLKSLGKGQTAQTRLQIAVSCTSRQFARAIALEPNSQIESEEMKPSKFDINQRKFEINEAQLNRYSQTHNISLYYKHIQRQQQSLSPSGVRQSPCNREVFRTMRQGFSSNSTLFKIRDGLVGAKVSASERQERVSHALKQRDQILEQIAQITNFEGFDTFFETYKQRLTRVNDRENYIFMKSLIQQINNSRLFIQKLTPTEKFEVIEKLLNNSHLFAKGSPQYHVPLEVSELYFNDLKSKEEVYTIVEMAKIISTTQATLDTEIPTVIISSNSHSNIFCQALSSYIKQEKNLSLLCQRLAECAPFIQTKMDFAQRKQFLSVLTAQIDGMMEKIKDEQDIKNLIKFAEIVADSQFSKSNEIKKLHQKNIRHDQKSIESSTNLHDALFNIIKSAWSLGKVSKGQAINSLKINFLEVFNPQNSQDLELLSKILSFQVSEPGSGVLEQRTLYKVLDQIIERKDKNTLEVLSFTVSLIRNLSDEIKAQLQEVISSYGKQVGSLTLPQVLALQNIRLIIEPSSSFTQITAVIKAKLDKFTDPSGIFTHLMTLQRIISQHKLEDSAISQIETTYYRLFKRFQILERDSNAGQYMLNKVRLFSGNFSFHQRQNTTVQDKINPRLLTISDKNQLMQIIEIYAYEILSKPETYQQGFESLQYLLQKKYLKDQSSLQGAIVHLLGLSFDVQKLKDQLMLNKQGVVQLMSGLKQRGDLYSMDDLVQLDYSLGSIYGEDRPDMFKEMILSKLQSASQKQDLNHTLKRVKGVCHLIGTSPKLEKLQEHALKIQRELNSLFDQDTFQNIPHSDYMLLSAYLYDNQLLQLDDKVLQSYYLLKNKVIIERDFTSLGSFVLGLNSFQIAPNQKEIEILTSMIETVFNKAKCRLAGNQRNLVIQQLQDAAQNENESLKTIQELIRNHLQSGDSAEKRQSTNTKEGKEEEEIVQE